MSDDATPAVDYAAAARKAAALNIIKRSQAGEKITGKDLGRLEAIAAGEIDQPATDDADATPAATWPSQAACARAIGIPPHRLRTLVRKGCPAPSGASIPQVPVWEWVWQHRALIPTTGEEDPTTETDRLKAERLRLGNDRLRQQQIDDASHLAIRILEGVRSGVRQSITPARITELRTGDDTQLAAAVDRLVERAIATALQDGAA